MAAEGGRPPLNPSHRPLTQSLRRGPGCASPHGALVPVAQLGVFVFGAARDFPDADPHTSGRLRLFTVARALRRRRRCGQGSDRAAPRRPQRHAPRGGGA